ncbi:MAG: hypothetical protein KIT31_38140 [Deltaproteobacteria bacterium]|nr:hypothetical protein [Deltaproteobacteria bacterium]
MRSAALLSFVGVVLPLATACGPGGPDFATEHPRIFVAANREALVANLATPAGERFRAMVDRQVGGGDIYGFQAWNAALLGQLTGDAKYCAYAVAHIDREVEEALDAVDDGKAPPVAHDSYLGVGDRIGDLALVYDWCAGTVGGKRAKWLSYAQQAVHNVWNHATASWGGTKMPWSGWAVDDPSDNYYYSFLRATMLLGLAAHGEQAGADAWLAEFRDAKLADQLVPTFDRELVGGGSREGTGYGVSQRDLFALYALWAGSTGETIATMTGHTRASMVAFLHATLPTLDRVAPTGDHSRDSTAALFDYHRDYLQQLIALFPDDPVAPRAQALLDTCSVPRMGQQFMYAHDFLHPGVAASSLDGLATAYRARGIGQLYARSGWDAGATWLNLTAGAYTQSHAHQDQGALLVYKGGWLAYDPNIDSHSGLRQEVEAHNLVRLVDGGASIEQRTGTDSELVALHRGAGYLHAAARTTPAYRNHAKVQLVEREVVYLEPDVIVVYDRVRTSAGTSQVWQLASPTAPQLAGATATIANAGHTLAVRRLAPAGATSSVHDFHRADGDYTGGFRLDATAAGGDNRYLHVLSIDGAATNIVQVGEGVTLTAGGRQIAVTFARDAVGGSLTIDGATVTLAAGLDALGE